MDVVIIGGGIGGTTLTRQLRGSLGITSITLIEPKSFLELSPGVISALRSHSNQQLEARMKAVCIPSSSAWPGSNRTTNNSSNTKIIHIPSRAQSIVYDNTTNTFQITVENNPNNTIIKSDIVVIATGTSSLPQHTAPWRPSSSITTFSQRMEQIHIHRKRIQESTQNGVLIIGSGVIAVEMICSLSDDYPSHQFHLILAKDNVLENLPHELGRAAMRNLRKRNHNVKIYENQGYVNIASDATSYQLQDGTTTIQFDYVIHAIGAPPNSSFCPSEWHNNNNNSHGLIQVDKYCRIIMGGNSGNNVVIPHAFAIGDVSTLTRDKSAKEAIHQAEIVLHNIRSLALGGREKTPPRKYHTDRLGIFISVGRSQALFRLNHLFIVTGYFGMQGSGSLRAHIVREIVFYRLVFKVIGLPTYMFASRSKLLKDSSTTATGRNNNNTTTTTTTVATSIAQ
jgi:NADH dehydrogenase FAD-containing subunit